MRENSSTRNHWTIREKFLYDQSGRVDASTKKCNEKIVHNDSHSREEEQSRDVGRFDSKNS